MSKNPPLWATVLEAANGDPLRAQEIEEKLSGYWYTRWKLWRNEKAEAGERK